MGEEGDRERGGKRGIVGRGEVVKKMEEGRRRVTLLALKLSLNLLYFSLVNLDEERWILISIFARWVSEHIVACFPGGRRLTFPSVRGWGKIKYAVQCSVNGVSILCVCVCVRKEEEKRLERRKMPEEENEESEVLEEGRKGNEMMEVWEEGDGVY